LQKQQARAIQILSFDPSSEGRARPLKARHPACQIPAILMAIS